MPISLENSQAPPLFDAFFVGVRMQCVVTRRVTAQGID
jgi:hypothetical protein